MPENFEINIKDAKIMAEAEFIVAYARENVTMPRLAAYPMAEMF